LEQKAIPKARGFNEAGPCERQLQVLWRAKMGATQRPIHALVLAQERNLGASLWLGYVARTSDTRS
jgi:hypothetical protein